MKHLIVFWSVSLCTIFASTDTSASQSRSPNVIDIVTKVDSIASVLDDQQVKILELQDFNNSYYKLVDRKLNIQDALIAQSTSSIENIIAASSWSLVYFGFFLAILGIVVSVYISKKSDHISNTLNNANIVLEDVKRIEKYIDSGLDGLYTKLQIQEIDRTIERLEQEPEDIENLFHRFSSIYLTIDNYDKLRKIYLENRLILTTNEIDGGFPYIALLFQHFPAKCFFDQEIKLWDSPDLTDHCENAFPREILNATKEIIDFVCGNKFDDYNEHLIKYFRGIENGRHKNLSDIYKITYDRCTDKSKKFAIAKILKNVTTENIGYKIFHKMLVEEFQDPENTTDEKDSLNDVQGING